MKGAVAGRVSERSAGGQGTRTLLDHGMVDIHDILGLYEFGSLLESGKSVTDAGNVQRSVSVQN